MPSAGAPKAVLPRCRRNESPLGAIELCAKPLAGGFTCAVAVSGTQETGDASVLVTTKMPALREELPEYSAAFGHGSDVHVKSSMYSG